MSEKKSRSGKKAEQKTAADALQRQIDDIIAGSAPSQPPRSLRDFIDQKTYKDARRKTSKKK